MMKSLWTKVASILLVSALTAAEALAQGGYGTPSLLPLPEIAPQFASPSYNGTVQRTGYTGSVVSRRYEPTPAAESVSPSETKPAAPTPPPATTPAPDSNYSSSPVVAQPGCNTCNGGYSVRGAFQQAMSNPWASDCNPCSACACDCERGWYASAGGLIMTRDRGNRLWTSYQTNQNDNQILNSESAHEGWTGGFETTIGRWCGCSDKLEVTYWGLWGMKGEANVTDANNNISSVLDNGFVTIGGAPADTFFDNAHEHLIQRSSDFNNVEVNWKHVVGCPCSSLELNWLTGFRFFEMNDQFHWETVQANHNFGDNGGINEACLHDEITNHMYGIQFGTEAVWHMTPCCSLSATPKIGLFGNHVTNEAYLKRGDDVYSFEYNSSKDDFALLGELDLKADYQIGCHWRLYGGYRVMGIDRIGLAENQIPAYLNDANGFREGRTNASLILHGVMLGAEFSF